jgi:hypothetical protein
MKYTINELANSKGVSQPVREALLHMEAELEATNRQVEILSDALAESRREVAAFKDVQEPVATLFGSLPVYDTTPPAAPVQEPVNQRAYEMALRQWESWKQYALELQEKLVKYEGGAPMVLNTTPPAAQRQWVGLEREIAVAVLDHCYGHGGVSDDMIERTTEVIKTKLKELNT